MKQKRSWWILFIVSLGVMIPFMLPYLTLDPARARVAIASKNIQFPLLVTHIIFAFIALVTGFLQFIERIRIQYPKLHRYLGRAYVISVFISGLLALVVVFYVENFTKALAFLALTMVWLVTCWKGYRYAMKGQFKEHRIWMIRSFGITLVAVSARIVVPLLLLSYFLLNGLTIPGGREQMVEEVLNVNIWVGLLLNFIIVEWIILKKVDAVK
ncbi:DUF2306 domain-containing protein [Paenibacillus psychroresistens]|uniref:DUF2306 domain-containing protein n=1 Tax=Paenibacillus psychroresistens TaxID=1778678 RepID=A0A6B8RR45_9BACL|nr:DUF2306 domain-containing protein [Paenibacillus psychroresistens]QGQ98860.1 DUF2306 domain-containing protein [Paenibacillus psychroresistens]